jgi:hypothetical protein
MTIPGRDELARYVMNEYDGDTDALEAALAGDGADAVAARVIVADEARFENLLRAAGAAARFCPGCRDLVRGDRCDACGAALHPGGYTVERVLVSNAHGRMYVARDADGRQVALKELAFVQAPSLAVVAAFEREARFLRALEHPAIPRFVASFEEGVGVHVRYYLAQELVAGASLAAALDEHWFTDAEIRDVARQVLRVLVYLQSLSPRVIHRDIKPANLVRRADGSIAVVDFGAAHVQGTTAGSTSIGTFGYMPIEQLAGQVDATTDPFALGASLLHLLSRQEPWRIVQSRRLEGINVSAALRDFLARLVAPEPAERFPDAAAALAALDALDAGDGAGDGDGDDRAAGSPTAIGGTALAIPTRGKRRDVWRAILYAAATLALLGVGGAGFAVARRATHAHDRSAPPAIEPGPPVTLPPGKNVDLAFKDVPLADLVRMLGEQCGVNVVIPDDVQVRLTVNLKDAPCDQALEVLLESNDLWYRYRRDANLIRVAPRRQLTDELRDELLRRDQGLVDDPLPAGPPVDFDLAQVPLVDLLRAFADVNHVNLVVPPGITARLTIRGHQMAWGPALQTVLASHGLWYRYRHHGKLLRIAARRQLDDEQRTERDARRPGP